MCVRSRRLNNWLISVWPSGDHNVVIRYGTVGVLPPFLILSRHAIVLDLFSSVALDAIPGHGLSIRSLAIRLTGHTTLDRTPLDGWSARCRDLFVTKRDIHKRQTSLPPGGIRIRSRASQRPQTHALDRAAAGIASVFDYRDKFTFFLARCKPYRAVSKYKMFQSVRKWYWCCVCFL